MTEEKDKDANGGGDGQKWMRCEYVFVRPSHKIPCRRSTRDAELDWAAH